MRRFSYIPIELTDNTSRHQRRLDCARQRMDIVKTWCKLTGCRFFLTDRGDWKILREPRALFIWRPITGMTRSSVDWLNIDMAISKAYDYVQLLYFLELWLSQCSLEVIDAQLDSQRR